MFDTQKKIIVQNNRFSFFDIDIDARCLVGNSNYVRLHVWLEPMVTLGNVTGLSQANFVDGPYRPLLLVPPHNRWEFTNILKLFYNLTYYSLLVTETYTF